MAVFYIVFWNCRQLRGVYQTKESSIFIVNIQFPISETLIYKTLTLLAGNVFYKSKCTHKNSSILVCIDMRKGQPSVADSFLSNLV